MGPLRRESSQSKNCDRDEPALFADYYAAVPDGVINDRWLGETRFFENMRDDAKRKAHNDAIKARQAASTAERPARRPPHCDFRTVEYGSGEGMRVYWSFGGFALQ